MQGAKKMWLRKEWMWYKATGYNEILILIMTALYGLDLINILNIIIKCNNVYTHV